MPKVFERDGYTFFFYSNEHRPVHVHVRRGGGEAVFNVEESVELRESQNMKVSELHDDRSRAGRRSPTGRGPQPVRNDELSDAREAAATSSRMEQSLARPQ